MSFNPGKQPVNKNGITIWDDIISNTTANQTQNRAIPTSNKVFRNELMTLEQVYQIEFGTRCMWKMTFDNGPAKYSGSILAQSCSETSRTINYSSPVPAGNWFLFVPKTQHQGGLSCTLYDDKDGTIEKWARQWWATTNKDQTLHNLQYPTEYATRAYVYHYNMQYDLIFARQYIVLPTGGIATGFESGNPTVSTVKLNFVVFINQDIG